MKRSFEKLSLEIRESKDRYIIICEDNTTNTKYKQKFECTKENEEERSKILDNAKEWLWNMGLYNGQANKLMRKCNIEWKKALKLPISSAESNYNLLN